MTEQEWLTSSDPQAMLAWGMAQVGHSVATGRMPRFSDRLLRLFAVACCRQVLDGKGCWVCNGTGKELSTVYGPGTASTSAVEVVARVPVMNTQCITCHGTGRTGGITDERSRNAVLVAEKFADGEATREELAEAYNSAQPAIPKLERGTPNPADEARQCCNFSPAYAAVYSTRIPIVVLPATQADLLRCLVGNPWRPVRWTHEEVDSEEGGYVVRCWNEDAARVRGWNGGAVVNLARHIYEDRAWDCLPVLADALEEAGCDNAKMLAHGRGPGPHGRGCWVVDLILGKE